MGEDNENGGLQSFRSNSSLDAISLLQMADLKMAEEVKKLAERVEDIYSNQSGFESVDLYYRKRLSDLEAKIALLEKDRHTHLLTQLEPAGTIPKGEMKSKTYPLSDWIKNNLKL